MWLRDPDIENASSPRSFVRRNARVGTKEGHQWSIHWEQRYVDEGREESAT
jgi:hypothetical protein